RVFIADVKAFARERNTRGSGKPSTPEAGVPELPDFERWGPVHREKRRMIQRETAKQMTLSWQQIPHVTQFDVADVTGLENVRQRYKEKAEKAGGKLTVTPIVAKVVASALKVFPKFNTSLDTERDQLVYKEYYHLGIAVDTERGLLVPVVRDIDRKNMIELAVEMQELAERTREGKIQADELEGATFTLTNLGGIGGTHFTPIVNWPQVAILGVGRAYKQPRFCGEACESRLLLPLALSYDHRVIDGADGARFLRWIVEALEEPLLLSLEG
ncbi:MAG: 2-oxo acid dehydrogenase subunit E2, partial [Kiritimatiellales bacterium]|nr:2-oxo acid dehydrogenase subunit E2 [Kiritimatiellales bacterium]